MRFHDAQHHGQAQARALAHGLGREEGFEHAALHRLVHAAAIVDHAQAQRGLAGLSARLRQRRRPARDGRGRRGHAVQRDLDRAAARRQGVQRVGAQVHQHLLQLRGVARHLGQRWRDGLHQLHLRRQGRTQQRAGLHHHRGQRHRRTRQGLLAAEGQDLAHQLAATPSGRADLAQAFLRRRVGRQVLAREVGVAQDGGQDVVEIVRHATGQRAQRLHLLRLRQPRFQRLLLRLRVLHRGDVDEGQHHAAQTALRVALRVAAAQGPAQPRAAVDGQAHDHIAHRLARHQHPLERPVVPAQRLAGLVEHAPAFVARLGHHAIGAHLAPGEEAPRGGVHAPQRVVGVKHHHARVQVVHQALQVGLALALHGARGLRLVAQAQHEQALEGQHTQQVGNEETESEQRHRGLEGPAKHHAHQRVAQQDAHLQP